MGVRGGEGRDAESKAKTSRTDGRKIELGPTALQVNDARTEPQTDTEGADRWALVPFCSLAHVRRVATYRVRPSM